MKEKLSNLPVAAEKIVVPEGINFRKNKHLTLAEIAGVRCFYMIYICSTFKVLVLPL